MKTVKPEKFKKEAVEEVKSLGEKKVNDQFLRQLEGKGDVINGTFQWLKKELT